MAFALRPVLRLLALSFLVGLLPPGGSSENCETYQDSVGHLYLGITCPDFCCGNCVSRYCCSDLSQKFDEYDQLMCNLQLSERTSPPVMGVAMKFNSELDDWHSHGPGITFILIGVAVFILIITTIVVCFTCSCCCLYRACRRPQRPIVTTTTSTTVVQVPYPQQPAGYPAGVYQGYSPVPVQPQPGMPAAPYPTQYPPPYIAQPTGPPAYHETMAAGAGAPETQPPYNPAYMDSTKPY